MTDFFNTSGVDGIVSYNELGSFAISENIETLQQIDVRFTQVGHQVQALIQFDELWVHLPPGPLQHWYIKYATVVAFNRYGLMRNFVHIVDILGAIRRSAAAPALNATLLCAKELAVCDGALKMNQFAPTAPENAQGTLQYANQAACEAYLATIPVSAGAAFNIGKSWQCINFHLGIAATGDAGRKGHCLHTGPLDLGALTPCQNH